MAGAYWSSSKISSRYTTAPGVQASFSPTGNGARLTMLGMAFGEVAEHVPAAAEHGLAAGLERTLDRERIGEQVVRRRELFLFTGWRRSRRRGSQRSGSSSVTRPLRSKLPSGMARRGACKSHTCSRRRRSGWPMRTYRPGLPGEEDFVMYLGDNLLAAGPAGLREPVRSVPGSGHDADARRRGAVLPRRTSSWPTWTTRGASGWRS